MMYMIIILLCLIFILKDYLQPSWLPKSLNPVSLYIAYHLSFIKYRSMGLLRLSQDDMIIFILYESWKEGIKWSAIGDIYQGYIEGSPRLHTGDVYFEKYKSIEYLYQVGY